MRYSLLTGLLILIVSFLLAACGQEEINSREYMPSIKYHSSDVNFSSLPIQRKVYIPIYSDIYIYSGERTFPLTATLSVRNTSFTDTMFVGKVDYYDSEGALTKEYLDSPIYIGPMETVEFVVTSEENHGGVGANFIVDWGTRSVTKNPVIQAVMIGDSNQQGISFVTEGIIVE